MTKQDWQAVQFMLISVSAFTIMNAIAKYLVNFHAFEIVFFRSIGTILICLLLLYKNKIPILGNQRKLLLLRSFMGIFAITSFYLAVKELPLGTVVSLRYLSPIFAALLAVLFLKSKVKPIQWLCFFVAFLGVVLIKGFDVNVSMIGLIYILISAFFTGAVYVIIQRIGQSDHPLVVVNYFMFCTMLAGLALTLLSDNWYTPVGNEWWIVGSMGFFGFFGQFFMTKAFQTSPVTTIAPFKYIEAVFALAVGFFFLGETYSAISLIGISLIIGGMLLNVRVK